MKNRIHSEYFPIKKKLYKALLKLIAAAVLIVYALYRQFWKGRGGNAVVSFFRGFWGMSDDRAHILYTRYFRNYKEIIWIAAIVTVFLLIMEFSLNWFFRWYFTAVNRGIDALLAEDDAAISLPPELAIIEQKLNTVKKTLRSRKQSEQLAEQRKNDLVAYLAHDLKTPLTSVIGYLSLLDSEPGLAPSQQAHYIHIALDKAFRLEKMIGEFFEITRYNLQQIHIAKEPIDLYYMLVQLCDELSPLLSAHGNTSRLDADEDLTINGDPDKLARVFNNVLKNAATYSYPDTEIRISAARTADAVTVSFANRGPTIPQEKLNDIFEKFYRLDEARRTDTGGAGLGLAIAKEIVTLHGGTIAAESAEERTVFRIVLPQQAAAE